MAKLIDLYKEWMETGEMPEMGLCGCLSETRYAENLSLFAPTEEDDIVLYKERKPTIYWGSGEEMNGKTRLCYTFTPLRQTIVLLICAIHNEL